MLRAILIVLSLSVAFLYGEDFSALYDAASEAATRKEFAEAEARFGDALKAATFSPQRCKAILGKFQAMRSQNRPAEAEAFALAAIEEVEMDSPEVRQILNTVAGTLLWSVRMDDGLRLLEQALHFECPNTGNVYYATYSYMATIYTRKGLHQAVIEVLGNVLNVKGQHPANLYHGHLAVARALEQLGQKEEALKHYRLALENGKMVAYKFNYQAAENAIKELTK